MAASRAIYIVSAKRTPFGTFGGKLKGFTATDLAVHASKAAIAAAKVDAKLIDTAVFGNVAQTSTDAAYMARHVALRAGARNDSIALTVNRLCGSGFQAIISGAFEIQNDEAKIALVGGAESMSQAPLSVYGQDVRFGHRLGADLKMTDVLWSALTDSYCNTPMGITAETLADKYGISRADSDAFSLRSQQGWAAAQKAGVFGDEIAAMEVKGRKGLESFSVDEHPRPETTMEGLAKLPPVFKKDGGRVTAGSASGISDGAAALVIASEEAVKAHGLKPLARIVGWSVAGVDPTVMGIGPVPAIRALLKRTGKTLADIDRIEVNEAFAAQALAVEKDLGIDRCVRRGREKERQRDGGGWTGKGLCSGLACRQPRLCF
jgi:acetyl-CoA acyltransferase 2